MAYSFTVTALDAYGNVATGYRGTVHFSSSDPRAKLHGNYTFSQADAGVHVFHVTFQTTGTQTVTVSDTADPSLKGTSTGVKVV